MPNTRSRVTTDSAVGQDFLKFLNALFRDRSATNERTSQARQFAQMADLHIENCFACQMDVFKPVSDFSCWSSESVTSVSSRSSNARSVIPSKLDGPESVTRVLSSSSHHEQPQRDRNSAQLTAGRVGSGIGSRYLGYAHPASLPVDVISLNPHRTHLVLVPTLNATAPTGA
jgi:hypothetical protein